MGTINLVINYPYLVNNYPYPPFDSYSLIIACHHILSYTLLYRYHQHTISTPLTHPFNTTNTPSSHPPAHPLNTTNTPSQHLLHPLNTGDKPGQAKESPSSVVAELGRGRKRPQAKTTGRSIEPSPCPGTYTYTESGR